MKNARGILLVVTGTLANWGLPAWAQAPTIPADFGYRIERRIGAMGTVLALEVEAADRETALAASEAAVRAVEAVEARLSTWRADSELARLNRAPPGEAITVSRELSADLSTALAWSRATGGAFDPAVGGLVRVWGLRGGSKGGRKPTDEEVRAALVPGGAPAALELADGRARRLDPGLCLEEGGFGKGVALDAALSALSGAGASGATLDFGGHVAVLGTRERRFRVADPRDRSRGVIEVTIDRGSLSTSGNSEHGIEIAGRFYGHLLDPRSGQPARDFGSLTVWAPDATAADCLSTGLYVLGPERALEFAAEHRGIAVLVIETLDGGSLRARASAGLAARVRMLDGHSALSIDDHDVSRHAAALR